MVQARALETRAKILAQAELAFAEHGVDGTSLTSDILEPAGVSVGSFYHQFDNKLEVLFALFEERQNHRDLVGRAWSAHEQPSFEDALRVGILALLDDVDRHPAAWWIRHRERLSPDPAVRDSVEAGWTAWRDAIGTLLAEWHDADPERSALAVRLLIDAVSSLLRAYLLADAGGRVSIRDTDAPAMATLCAHGVERVLVAAS